MTEMKINQQELMAACQEVIQYSRKMAADGLVVGTSGISHVVLGRLIPKCAYTDCTNPEQSAPSVRLVPPHTPTILWLH